jgi:cation diffusion facilitator CzcD-associated flavoprotein CzcO
VVVLGSGCSAAQIMPSLLKEPYNVKSLTQIGRSALWVMSRLSEPFGKAKYAKYAPTVYKWFPFLEYLSRVLIYLLVEVIWSTAFQMKHAKWRDVVEQQQLDMMKDIAPKEYHHLLTPDYPYGCKRRVFDAEWLPSMHKPNYTLTNRKVVAVDGNQLVLGPEEIAGADKMGVERINADVVILANRFEAQRWLHPLSLRTRCHHYARQVEAARGSGGIHGYGY